MQPILQNSIRYRTGRKGFPRKCIIKLFPNHIELADKHNVVLEHYQISQIVRAGFGNNVIVLLLADTSLVSLYFESLRRRVLFRGLFGIVGSLLVQKVGKSRQAAESWLQQLELLGIPIRRSTKTTL